MRAVQANIVELAVDGIVNAANTSLLGGGGVDGAIHRAAGPDLLRECRTLGGAQTGDAKVTSAYDLKAKYVIHTVGPVWHGGAQLEAQMLASCYQTCMAHAKRLHLQSIAFPAISTGVYGFPMALAAPIAVQTVGACLADMAPIDVIFCCFDAQDLKVYQTVLDKELG